MKSVLLEELQQSRVKGKQATLREVLESCSIHQRVSVQDLDDESQNILGGSALDVFNMASPHLLSRPFYSIDYKSGSFIIKLGED